MAQINKPSEYFNTKLYTGNGSTQSITGVGFQPDFTWIKVRNDAYGHDLYDIIRGATKTINTNLTNAEYTSADRLTSFNSDGFTLGSGVAVNNSGGNYVGWNWKANGAGVSNTAGSITSTVSANTTSGFSIVSYTGNGVGGATVGHGLGVAPAMIILKNRTSGVEQWHVLHKSLNTTGGQYLLLSATNAVLTNSVVWNSTAPTSSVFSIGTAGGVNGSGNNLIAYCFAEKKGFSKFGSYTGNGNADGTFVYTGFKPAWVMVKRTDSAGNSWRIWDKVRSPSNVMSLFLYANLSNAEGNDVTIDFLSNGFKFRNTSTDNNASGASYIYMAFAEHPLVGTNNIPTTAR